MCTRYWLRHCNKNFLKYYCLFVEVLCRSLGVEARPNNGTWERVRGMFRKVRKSKKLEANKRRKIE